MWAPIHLGHEQNIDNHKSDVLWLDVDASDS